jgi:hypothetical protein
MTDWYCKISGKLYGPYDHAKLRQMAVENRLMPDDLLREGKDGEWFPADEIEDLFPESRRSRRDEYDDDDLPRRRKKRGRSVNYYSQALANLQEFGHWTQYIGWTAVFSGLMFGITVTIRMIRAGHFDAGMFILATVVGAIMVMVFCFFDVLLFGIPCMIMGLRPDPRRHYVLDLFGYAYIVTLAVFLFRLLVSCLNPMIADFLLLLIPFCHAAVFGYFMHNNWGLSGAKAWGLASVRFAYLMLCFAGYLIARYYVE